METVIIEKIRKDVMDFIALSDAIEINASNGFLSKDRFVYQVAMLACKANSLCIKYACRNDLLSCADILHSFSNVLHSFNDGELFYDLYPLFEGVLQIIKGYSGIKAYEGSEKEIQDNIVENFNKINQFQEYEFIGKEATAKVGCGRIDILAMHKKELRKVIIEIKKGNQCGRRQLLEYAAEENNPILINISEREVKRHYKGITYYTVNELLSN